MKKILASVLSITLAMSMMSGCGNSSNPSKNKDKTNNSISVSKNDEKENKSEDSSKSEDSLSLENIKTNIENTTLNSNLECCLELEDSNLTKTYKQGGKAGTHSFIYIGETTVDFYYKDDMAYMIYETTYDSIKEFAANSTGKDVNSYTDDIKGQDLCDQLNKVIKESGTEGINITYSPETDTYIFFKGKFNKNSSISSEDGATNVNFGGDFSDFNQFILEDLSDIKEFTIRENTETMNGSECDVIDITTNKEPSTDEDGRFHIHDYTLYLNHEDKSFVAAVANNTNNNFDSYNNVIITFNDTVEVSDEYLSSFEDMDPTLAVQGTFLALTLEGGLL